MPGHGNHWETLYATEEYLEEKITRDIQEGKLICKSNCMDVEGGTNRTEQVSCLRWGSDRLTNQILVVSNSAKKSNFLFSGYPVVLDGAVTEVTISRAKPWEYGIEGWIHGTVTNPLIADRERYIAKAKAARFKVVGIEFQIATAIAISRNASRVGKKRVPEKAIYATAAKFQSLSLDEGFDEIWLVTVTSDGLNIEEKRHAL